MKSIVLAGLIALAAPAAHAAVLLNVDLSVTNQITITATSGASDETVIGGDITGFYLGGFFGPAKTDNISDTLVSGNLTSAQNTSDLSPDLFSTTSNLGLNVWSYTDDADSSFFAGQTAFTGAATWTIDATSYVYALAAPTSGSIYFQADSDDDIPTASTIGEWARVSAPSPVPLPAAVWLLGAALLGLGAVGRRRA